MERRASGGGARALLAVLVAAAMAFGMLPAMAFAADVDSQAAEPCTVTEGCTLEAGHEGECISPAETEEPADETDGVTEPDEIIAEETLAVMVSALPDPSEIDPLDEEQVRAVNDQISAIYAFAEANGLGNSDDGLFDEAADAIVNAVIAAMRPAETLEDPTTEGDMSGNCGATGSDNVTWTLEQNNEDNDNPTYTLTISGTGAMADYTDPTKSGDEANVAPWYSVLTPDGETNAVPINQIVVGDTITGLGNYAFAYTSVEQTEFKANVKDYGDALYYCCKSLITVNWDNFAPENISDGWVTERKQTGPYIPFSMFDGCSNLKNCKIGETTYDEGKLVFPKNVTGVMTAAFRYTAFDSIDFEGSNITCAGAYAFAYMDSLTDLTLPGKVEFYQQNDGKQSSAFEGCGLQSVTVGSDVTTIPYRMFCNCKKLANVVVAENSCLETIGLNAFYDCETLTSFDFPDSLKEIQGYAFQKTALTSVTIGQLETMGSSVFAGCTKLENVEIEGSASLELSHGLFGNSQSNCAPLKTLKIGTASVTSNLFTDQKNTIETIAFKNVTVSNGSNMFQNCTALKSLTLGNGFTEIASGMVSGCSVLETIVIPDTVTAIATNSFKDCAKLKNVTIGENVASIGDGAFRNCVELETIAIPDSVTTIGNSAFYDCSSLGTVSISNGSKLKTIGSSAFRNTKVAYFYIPSGLTSIGSQAFFTDSDPEITYVVYDLSDWDVDNLTTSTFGKWCFSQWWTTNNDYTKITRIFYLSDESIVDYLPTVANSEIYKTVDGSSVAERTKNAIYAVTDGGTFAADTEFTASTLATPTKANYKFLGWYDNEECTGTAVTTPEVEKTYYAKWEAKTASTISFKDSLKLDKTYDGKAVSLSEDDYTVTGSKGTVTISYQVKDVNDWKDVDTVPTNAGTYRVKATVAENDTYASAETDWKEFTISKADQTISFTSATLTAHINAAAVTNTLNHTAGDGTVTYSSSNENVAIVDANGQVTIKGAGETVITATAAETKNHNSAAATYTLTVSGHSYGEYVSNNDATCTVDGTKTAACTHDGCTATDTVTDTGSAKGHTFQWVVDKEATETEKGSKHEECSVCGHKEHSVEIPTLSHAHSAVKTEAKPATEAEDGNIAYWYCPGCGKYFSDEALTEEIALADTVISATGEVPAEDGDFGETAVTTVLAKTGDFLGVITLALAALAAAMAGVALLARSRARRDAARAGGRHSR